MVRGECLVRKRGSKVCWPAAARSNSETLLLAQPCSCSEGQALMRACVTVAAAKMQQEAAV